MKLKQSMVGASSWRTDKHLRLLIDRNRIALDSVSAKALSVSARGSGEQASPPRRRLTMSLLGTINAPSGKDTIATVSQEYHESQTRI